MTDQVSRGNGQHQRWAASGKQRVASGGSGWQQGGSRGAAGWRRWLTMEGVVLLGCWGGSHWQMAFVMMCWMWCGRRHCQWDSDCTDARRKRDKRKIWLRQDNVYVRKNKKDVTHWVIRCAEKHCWWDNNENDPQGSRDLQKIWSSQRNVYVRRNLDVTLWTIRFEI